MPVHPLRAKYDAMCQLARDLNQEGLRQYLRENTDVCIALSMAQVPVVEQLAREGRNNAVALLIQLFYADRNAAARGCAHAGNVHMVESLRLSGASDDACLQGYAEGDHLSLVLYMLNQGANHDHAVLGLALAGKQDKAANFMRHYRVPSLIALQGYAQSGNRHLTNHYITDEAELSIAILGAAMGGHTAMVEALLLQGDAEPFAALEGFACAGLRAEVDHFINELRTIGLYSHDALLEHAALHYAANGFVGDAKACIDAATDKSRVRGFAAAGLARAGLPVSLISQYLAFSGDDAACAMREICRGYAYGGHVALLIAEFGGKDEVSAQLSARMLAACGNIHVQRLFALHPSAVVKGVALANFVAGYNESMLFRDVKQLMRLLVFAPDDRSRNMIAAQSHAVLHRLPASDVVPRANAVAAIMLEHGMNYTDAQQRAVSELEAVNSLTSSSSSSSSSSTFSTPTASSSSSSLSSSTTSSSGSSSAGIFSNDNAGTTSDDERSAGKSVVCGL